MSAEAKKLHLIEEILKIDNDAVLEEVETLLNRSKLHVVSGRRSFASFAGMLNDEEINELERAIDEGCEQIFPDEWK